MSDSILSLNPKGGKRINYLHGVLHPVLVGRGWGIRAEGQFLYFRTILYLFSMRISDDEQGVIVKDQSVKLDA